MVEKRAEIELHEFWAASGLAQGHWEGALGSYRRYYGLIRSHNARAGLMGDCSLESFYYKHVADSLAVLLAWPEMFRGPVRLADVGCGAGLPGIVLALALPQLHLTAMESNHKKADFVAMAAGDLGLSRRVEVMARNSRQAGHEKTCRGRFDVVTARAVGQSDRLIRDCRMLLARGASAVLYKTPRTVANELPLAQRQADKHGLTLETSETIILPARAGDRRFIRAIAGRRAR